ncbi:ATP-binding protein [Arthrobacter sp. NPDC093128]|uniref:ATP-binding protein n=1 Tax=Arthrobacter sp. NPDC093128 TaxID=3154979 RepID=UPI003427A295
MGRRFSLRAAAVPDSLELVHDLLGELWEGEPGIELMDRIRFETALIEVASNIIEHSRPAGDDSVRFVLTLECEPERLYAEFTDNARPAGIDLSRAELPGDLSASGRGLALAKVALDQFSYAKEDDGNRWTLLCRRKSEATAPQ